MGKEDLISRQAVLDIVLLDPGITSWQLEMINKLPSAQPDLDEWCMDCSEYDSEKHCCPRWNRVIRNTLKDAQPKIIRCKDCKHMQSFKGVDWCMKLVRHTEPDFFCGFGEEVKDATAQDSIRS